MSAQTKAGSEPAFPVQLTDNCGNPTELRTGFSKRDLACIELRIPATGDAELDALIARAQRRDLAAKSVSGLLIQDSGLHWGAPLVARYAVEQTDALIAELEKAHG